MRRRAQVAAARAGVAALILAAWQYLPDISYLREHWRFLDPTFISSPISADHYVYQLITGTGGVPFVIPYLKNTLIATLAGVLIGMAAGIIAGLIASSYSTLSDILWPFIVAANSIPRIALVPFIVLLVGPTTAGAVVSAILIVFFVGFFNALEGGRSVPARLLEHCILMGASPRQRLIHLRLPYVLSWSFAAVPNAVSLGLIAVVTTEILTGTLGMGSLIQQATTSLNAGLTFGVIIILAAVGLVLTLGAQAIRNRIIRWPL